MIGFWRRLFGLRRRAGIESRRFAGYNIIKILHEGEKAIVYQARPREGDGLYAIKAYKPEYDRTARRIRRRYHLRSEGEIGLLINPPAGAGQDDFPIVRTIAHGHEFDDPSGCCYVVLEFIEGYNLKHMIGCGHALLRQKRLEIARAIARALNIIHERGFIHRDVCSDNVLVRRDGCAKLIDLGFVAPFGIRFREKSGTPSYMSPEQFQAKPLHPASDIYSFGVVLFEIFTGRLPFTSQYSADNPKLLMRRATDLMEKHLRQPPPSPSKLAPDLPEGIEEIVLRCLQKNPERRYPGMKALMVALAAVRDSTG